MEIFDYIQGLYEDMLVINKDRVSANQEDSCADKKMTYKGISIMECLAGNVVRYGQIILGIEPFRQVLLICE